MNNTGGSEGMPLTGGVEERLDVDVVRETHLAQLVPEPPRRLLSKRVRAAGCRGRVQAAVGRANPAEVKGEGLKRSPAQSFGQVWADMQEPFSNISPYLGL